MRPISRLWGWYRRFRLKLGAGFCDEVVHCFVCLGELFFPFQRERGLPLIATFANGFPALESAGATMGAIIAEPMPIAKPDTILPFSHATAHLLWDQLPTL